jgi:hypothetical protein
VPVPQHLDALHPRRVEEEHTFHANSMAGDSSDGHIGLRPTATNPNYRALEYLDTLSRTFDDSVVYSHSIANLDLWNLVLHGGSVDVC